MLHREVNGWSRQRKPVGLDTLGWFDFEVGPGPALYVYLVPKEQVRQSAGVKNTIFVHLGRLRAFKAAMKYNIPAGVDLKAYPSVVIWCARFGVLISPADLKFER